MVIGKLERLKYGVYKCNGWISDWTRCSFRKDATEVERLNEWKIPDSLLDEDFFSEFEFVKHDSNLVFAGNKKKKEKTEKKEKKEKTTKSPKKRKTEATMTKVIIIFTINEIFYINSF